MTSFTIRSARNLAKILILTPLVLAPLSSLAAPLEIDLTVDVPRQQNQVALVPFSGDSVVSPVVLRNLNSTDLKVTSTNLPQQPRSSSELAGTLSVWQSTGIPYLVVGNTRANGSKLTTDYEVIEVKTGHVIKGKQTLSYAKDTGSMSKAGILISDKVHELITGIPGDFSGRIAYIEEIGAGKNKTSRLKVMDADGENAKTIFEIKGSIFSPTWAPDGKRIAYSVQGDKAYHIINVQNVDGGAANSIVPFKATNIDPSFSPDGTKLLFSSSNGGSLNIYEMNAGGGGIRQLTNLPGAETQPNYSPDGRSFVFVSDAAGLNKPQIYRYDLSSGRISQVSRGGYATTPRFNHDGTQIAFVSGSSASIMNSSGGVITNLGSTGLQEGASFSPNGKRVVYATRQGNTGVINIKSLNGGDAFGKSSQGIIHSPVWSAAPK